MISERAKDSFERIFFEAARSRLPAAADHACEIEAHPGDAPPLGENVVVLTISSVQFRLLVLLHFNDDERMRAYYVGDAERTLAEAFMEFGNLCCGSINQHLVEHFPDLGMSTPYTLDSRCLAHLRELKPAHVASYRLTLDGSVPLGATLCICASAPLDFVAADFSEATDSSGELELF